MFSFEWFSEAFIIEPHSNMTYQLLYVSLVSILSRLIVMTTCSLLVHSLGYCPSLASTVSVYEINCCPVCYTRKRKKLI